MPTHNSKKVSAEPAATTSFTTAVQDGAPVDSLSAEAVAKKNADAAAAAAVTVTPSVVPSDTPVPSPVVSQKPKPTPNPHASVDYAPLTPVVTTPQDDSANVSTTSPTIGF